MQLPFSIEQFYSVFRAYNTAIWPAQVLLLSLAPVAVVLVLVRMNWSGVAISAILAFFWSWLSLAYHLAFFTAINPLAYAFAAISLAGAFIFFWQGVICRRLEFQWTSNFHSIVGFVLIAFALIVYPSWSVYAGHGYPALPTFGLPCPTTIFTIGILAFMVSPYPRSPLVVPVLWCFVGGQAAFLLGVPPDSALIVAGFVGLFLFTQAKVAAARTGARQ